MKRISRNALVLVGLVGAVLAVRSLAGRQGAGTAEGEAHVSYSDGSMDVLKAPRSEEMVQISRGLIETGL